MFIGRCKASNEDILNSISGISWVDAQKERMTVIQEHIDYLNKSIESVKKLLMFLSNPMKDISIFFVLYMVLIENQLLQLFLKLVRI